MPATHAHRIPGVTLDPPLDKPTRASEGPAVPGLHSTLAGVNFDTNPTYNSGFFFIPPDPITAAGPTHVVSVVNGPDRRAAQDRCSRDQPKLAGLFTSLTPVNFLFDPKVIYDQYNSRFMVVALELVNSPTRRRAFWSPQQTSDPTAGLWFTAINSKISMGGLNRSADYSGLAIDDKAVASRTACSPFPPESAALRCAVLDHQQDAFLHRRSRIGHRARPLRFCR